MLRRLAIATTCLALYGCNGGVDLPPRPDGSTPPPSGCGQLSCSLQPDDLLITEILYDPAGDDSDREWFEIYNNSGAKIATLAGVVLEVWSNSTGPDKGKSLVIQETGAPALDAGGFLTIGQGGSSDAGPTVAVGLAWSSMPALNNSAGSTIRIKCCDGTEITKISYAGEAPWPNPAGGTSIQLSQAVLDRPERPDTATAVDPKYWCGGDASGGEGTPAARNGVCAVAGECLENGTSRPIKAPAAGELKFSEIFTSPAGTDDYKEWVELEAKAAVDLNDLVLVHTNPSNNARESVITSPDCLALTPGQFVVLGSSKNASDAAAADYNGGVQGVSYAFDSKQFLYNDACTLELKTADGTVIDSVQHAKAKDGVALCFDPLAAAWGDSTDSGQFEGTGTPGNGTCTHAVATP